MNREAQDTLLLFVGVMVLQVGITDLHLRYVKPQMQPFLLVAGAVLTALAVVSIVKSQRRRAQEPHEGHSHMPRTSWLLALPLLVLTVVTPQSLGAYAAARGGTTVIDEPSDTLPALPDARDGAIDLTLTDYATRALYAPETLEGETLRLTGFVLPEEGDWYVARIALSCCAADGRPVKVQAVGGPAPAADSWVEAVGRYVPADADARNIARFEVTDLRAIEPPTQQYE
jgi:uncharacterized repeat protein (TIGR03943 family)